MCWSATSSCPTRMVTTSFATSGRARRGRSRGDARDDRRQLTWIHRLGHVHAVAGGHREHPVLGASVCREGYRGRVASMIAVEGAHLADQRVAVLGRHLDVRYQHVGTPLL